MWSLLLLHFWFNCILFGHTSYVNFHFNWCSVFAVGCFELGKRFEWPKSLLLRFPSPGKKIPPPVKFPIPPNPLSLFGRPRYIKLYGPFLWMRCNCIKASRLCRATIRRQFTFYQKFLVLMKSFSEGWKAEMTLKPSSAFDYKLESQYVELTELWPLAVNCFKVSSQSYLAGLSKICFFCTYVDQMVIQ